MADVFVSYSRKDRDRVRPLVDALEHAGLSVWWDRDLISGEDFGRAIEREISAATAVVVVWSKHGAESQWVRDEASLAQRQNKLFPVSIDTTVAPLGFQQLQSLDLSAWNGDPEFPELQLLAQRVGGKQDEKPAKPVVPNKETRGALFNGVLAVLLLGCVALAWFGLGEKSGIERSDPKQHDAIRLAVLPFSNLSNDAEDELFVDGLSEELLNRFSAVVGLQVPGRTSAFRFKGKTGDPQSIGRSLKVEYLLEGAVRRSGDVLRVTCALIEPVTGFTRWSQTYDREVSDIFQVQDDIARAVVNQLLGAIEYEATYLKSEQVGVSADAHIQYLEGRALWSRRSSAATEKFRKAIAIDPEHALAQAYLAIASAYFIRSPDPEISQSLNAAVALRPQSPDVLFAQGWVAEMLGKSSQSSWEQFYQMALRANPRSVEALYAVYRLSKDQTLLETALGIDPAHVPSISSLAAERYQLNDMASGGAVLDQTYAAFRDFPIGDLAAIAKDYGDISRMARLVFADWSRRENSDPFSLALGPTLLADFGRFDDALFFASQSPGPFGQLNAAALREDYDQYIALSRDPQVPGAFRSFAHALGLTANGNPADALEVLQRRWPEVFTGQNSGVDSGRFGSSGDWVAMLGAVAMSRIGKERESAQLFRKILASIENNMGSELMFDSWSAATHRSIAHANLGNRDQAMAFLQHAYDRGFRFPRSYGCSSCIWPAIDDPIGFLAPLVGDPEFQAFMKRLNLENERLMATINERYATFDTFQAARDAASERATGE
ncbi:MAG: TIR domain-containing protein [Lysobacterales bacterium]